MENNDKEYKLTLPQIIIAHDYMIKCFGGLYGIRDEQLLQSIATSPYQEIFGEVLYPTVYDKAAKLLFDFSHYQVFLDGNKRTGEILCTTLLEGNNIELLYNNNEIYNLTLDVANDKIKEVSEISKLLKENSIEHLINPINQNNNNEQENNYESR